MTDEGAWQVFASYRKNSLPAPPPHPPQCAHWGTFPPEGGRLALRGTESFDRLSGKIDHLSPMTCPLSSGSLYWRKGGGILEKIWKNGRFWGCVLLFAGLFGLALYFEHIDRYHPFPYIMVFHALTLVSWVWGLYHRRRPGDRRA